MVLTFRDKAVDTTVYISTLVFIIVMIIFGNYFHPIEELYGPEHDYYVAKANHLLAGRLPINDAIHPLFYPILAAVVSLVIGDTFAAASIVSTLSAGGFVLLTYLLGRQSFNRTVALFAFLACLINYHVIIEGLHASSDMTAAVLLLLAFFLLIKAGKNPSPPVIIFMGMAFALAYFTRYTAILFLPTCLLGLLWTKPNRPIRRRLISLSLFLITLFIFLVPHFYINNRIFGDPFYNENYKNLAMKLTVKGNWNIINTGKFREDGPIPSPPSLWEWSYLGKNEFSGFTDVVRRYPRTFLISGCRDFFRVLYLRLPELGGGGVAGIVFTILFFVGVCRLFYFRRRVGLLYFSAVFFMISGISFASVPQARHLLPLLSILYIIAASTFLDCPKISYNRSIIGIVILVSLIFPMNCKLKKFIENHPLSELNAAMMLEERFGQEITVWGTFPFIKRYVQYKFIYLNDATGDERNNDQAYFRRIEKQFKATGADYLIVGKYTLKHRPHTLISRMRLPAFLQTFYSNHSVVVYKIDQ